MRNQTSDIQKARELSTGVKVADTSKANISGSQVDMGMFLGQVPRLPAITYTLDNSGGGAVVRYVIGDPTTMIAQLVATGGVTVDNPSAVQGQAGLVVPNKNFFFGVGIIFGSINFQTSSTPNQFAQQFKTYITNMAGEVSSESLNLASATRNSAFNFNLLTLTGQFYLDIHRGIVIDVLAGEEVNVTMSPSAYTV